MEETIKNPTLRDIAETLEIVKKYGHGEITIMVTDNHEVSLKFQAQKQWTKQGREDGH